MSETIAPTAQEKIVYSCSTPSCTYFFKDGKPATFIRGRFITSNPSQIAELDHEIANNHPTISRGEQYTPDMDDPMLALRKRIREEIIAEELEKMRTSQNPSRDLGTSEQGKIKAQSTSDISAVTLGSGGASGAQLTALVNNKVK